MDTSIENMKAQLKAELKNPALTELKCIYIIQKIKLLSQHENPDKPKGPGKRA